MHGRKDDMTRKRLVTMAMLGMLAAPTAGFAQRAPGQRQPQGIQQQDRMQQHIQQMDEQLRHMDRIRDRLHQFEQEALSRCNARAIRIACTSGSACVTWRGPWTAP